MHDHVTCPPAFDPRISPLRALNEIDVNAPAAAAWRLLVTECVPGRRLSWSTTIEGDETGSTASHGGAVTPTDADRHVLSEETQQGPAFLEELGRKHPGGIYGYHQQGVEALAGAAVERAAGAAAPALDGPARP